MNSKDIKARSEPPRDNLRMRAWLTGKKVEFQHMFLAVSDDRLREVCEVIMNLLEYLLETDSNYSQSLEAAFSTLESQLTNFPTLADVRDGHAKIINIFQNDIRLMKNELVRQINTENCKGIRSLDSSIVAALDLRFREFDDSIQALMTEFDEVERAVDKHVSNLNNKLDILTEIHKENRKALQNESTNLSSREDSIKTVRGRLDTVNSRLLSIDSMTLSSFVAMSLICVGFLLMTHKVMK